MRKCGENRKRIQIFVIYSMIFAIFTIIQSASMQSASFIFGEDGVHQFYPVYVYIGRYIRDVWSSLMQGNFQLPQFDLTIGMGEDIITALNYYGFGNIFYLSAAFFSIEHSEIGYTFLIFLQLYMAGIAYCWYAMHRNYSAKMILGSVYIYLFSIYTLTYGYWYPVYLMPLFTLPIIFRGIDVVLEEKRVSKGLVIGVLIQACAGFYHTYMVLIFAGIYGLIKICNGYTKRDWLKQIGILLFQVVLGLGLSGVIFIPALRGFLHSPRVDGSTVWETIENMMQMERLAISKMFGNIILPNSYDRDCIELALPYFAVVSIIVSWKSINDKNLKMLGIVTVIMYVLTPVTSFIMGGFPKNIYYNRWLFCFAFIVALLAGKAIESIHTVSIKAIVAAVVISGIYVILTVKLGMVGRGSFFKNYFFYGVIIAIGFVVLLLLYLKRRNQIGIVIAILNIILVAYTGYYQFYVLHGNHRYVEKGTALEAIYSSPTQQYAAINQEQFTRIDIPAHNQNQPTVQGCYGIAEYYSIVPRYKADFFNAFEINETQPWFFTSLKGVDTLEDLLCVSYYQSGNEIVENEDFLPLGSTFHDYILEEDADKMSVEERRSIVLDTLILDREPDISLHGTTCESMSDISIQTNRIEGQITLENARLLFIAVPYMDGWSAYIDGIETEVYCADYGFTSLAVPEGTHTIELEYRTPGMILGVICSLVSILIFVACVIREKRVTEFK